MRTLKALLALATAVSTHAAAQTVDLPALADKGAIVARDRSTGFVSFVGTPSADARLAPPAFPGDTAANARAQLDGFAPHFGIKDPARTMQVKRVRAGTAGATVRFQQTQKSIPVFAGDLVVNTDRAGSLLAIAGKVTDQLVDPTPTLDAAAAARQAVGATARKYGLNEGGLRASAPALWVYDPRLLGLPNRGSRLVWRTVVTSATKATVNELVLVDAHKGAIALAYTQIHAARNRTTYDTNNSSALPGTLECTEAASNCTSGAVPDADKAHDFAADVYDFYFSRFGRDAIDGMGGEIISTTRYCQPGDTCPMANAFWDGTQMAYGAGMVADDVAAHEFTHGITAAESELLYFAEPGAINESISDIFGEFVDLVNGKGNDVPAVRWMMGEDSALGVIRSMSNPPSYGQPDRKGSSFWYTGGQDNGGVHENSGVGNKAAFLMVDGGTFNGRTVIGIGLEKAAQIYYEAQTMLLGSGSNYQDLYNALFQACTNLAGTHGITGDDCNQVRTATQAVEMNATSPATTAKAYCPAGGPFTVEGYDDFESAGATGTLARQSVGTYWYLDSNLSVSGSYSAVAVDNNFVSDSSLVYQMNVPVQAGDYFYFEHTWDTDYRYDGVVVEYSINNGTTWTDAGGLRVLGQAYNSSLLTSAPYAANNPLAGRLAYTGFLAIWTSTVYDLSPLAGKTVRFRFRSGTDGYLGYYGFNLDDVTHYRCGGGDFKLTSDAQSVSESVGSAIVTVSRGSGAAGAATVNYATADGTALAGVDYTARTGTLSWAANDARPKTIAIPIISRPGVQGERTFTLSLTGATGGSVSTPSAQAITIGNYDGVIQFSAPSISVNENGPNVTLTVTRIGFAGPAASVAWSTAAGSATAISDFTSRSGVLSWVAGDSSPKTITIGPVVALGAYVPIVNDPAVEGLETFVINLASPTGAALGATSSATVTIVSEENGVTMAAATRTLSESGGTQAITVARGGLTGAVDVNYAFANGTAINGTHFVGANGSLHWDSGDNSTRTISVDVIDNAAINTGRTFTVTLSGATGAVLAAPTATAVTIADDDNTVQFSAATATVTESVATASLTLTRMGVAAGQSALVHWSAVNGTAIAGTDYGLLGNGTPTSGDVTWPAGDSAPKTINIPILNNATLNGSRAFTVQLSGPTGPNLAIGGLSTATVTINDDERGVKFDNANYIINEGTSTAIKVNRVGPTTAAMTATWATVNGTAVSGTDFGILGTTTPRTGTVTWGIGDGADKTIIIPALQTVGNQADRSFNVVLTPVAGVTLGSPGTTTVTIQDDDIPAESNVRFDVSKLVVLETVGTAVLTVHRELAIGQPNPSFARDVTVKYATVPGTALATSDYVPATNGSLHWGPGDSSDRTISINIVNNTLPEPTESFKVVLSAPTAGLGFANPSDAEATISILDDDEAFPLDGVIPAGFSQAAATTKSWHVSNNPGAYEGAFSLKSDEIDDGETAGIEMNGTFAAGTVSFKVKISSEPNFDELRFFIDGVLMQKWSGTAVAGWQTATFPIANLGVHSLKWVYAKDGSVSVGMDAAYIDALTTPSFTP